MKKVKEAIGLEKPVPVIAVETPERDAGYVARQAGMQTVNTSMRGILRSKDDTPQRKKLLGE